MQDVLRKLSYTSSGEISPMAAMFGGVVGQEVMKAASGKFHPLFQFFYFDSIESLPEEDLTPEDVSPQARTRLCLCLYFSLGLTLLIRHDFFSCSSCWLEGVGCTSMWTLLHSSVHGCHESSTWQLQEPLLYCAFAILFL